MPLRFWLARRPKLREAIRGLFARVVHSWYRKQARAAGHNNPQFGGRVAMGVRAGRKVRKLQLGSTRERKLPPLCAEAGYFNLHAGVRVRAQDRTALERLCRYVARPPLSHARLKRCIAHRK